jgi:hypothetical protein
MTRRSRHGTKRGPGRFDTWLKKHPEVITEWDEEAIVVRGWHTQNPVDRDPQDPDKGEVRSRADRELLQKFSVIGKYKKWPSVQRLKMVRAWFDHPALNPAQHLAAIHRWVENQEE